jgi:hypothetical protein
VTDQVSHPYSTTSKITVLYILIFRFLYETGRQKILAWIIKCFWHIYSIITTGMSNSGLSLIFCWSVPVECMEDMRNAYKILVRKPEGKITLRKT